MKENKYFTPINFWLPVLYMTVLGIFFNEESSYTAVMHRDQTDEWKGWMQLVILVYHMTGASASVPIYMHVRVLISAYLFLAGYGHFSHFWARGKTGNLASARSSKAAQISKRLQEWLRPCLATSPAHAK